MKNIINYFSLCIAVSLTMACTKDSLWNQDGQVSETEKATIQGQLINNDDDQPLKGIKILFERQTAKDGRQTFVDTINTDAEGKFSYKLPYPNIVRVAIRDTGRYEADTAFVEVLEHKNYAINMRSHPRFGVANIGINLLDENKQVMESVNIALYTRESSSESYSLVDIFQTDAQGNVVFEDIAFPVRYKVEIVEKTVAYELDALEGFLQTKDNLNLTLNSRAKFGKADVSLIGKYFFTNQIAANTDIAVSYKSVLDEEFSAVEMVTLDADGKLILPELVYPSEVQIMSATTTPYPFEPLTVIVEESNANEPILMNMFDSTPRYWNMTPSSSMSENTLVAFYDGVKVQEMELDSKGNIYAVTTDNQLVRITHDGSSHKVLATGFKNSWGLALQDDYTMYVVENTDGHSVKKVVIDPETDMATVSLFAGNGSNSGTTDGVGTAARFNRPGDAVYDSSRKCLWVVEWAGARIRKIDVETGEVTTLATSTGYGFGVELTSDYKYLYIATHTSPAGIVKYDIENNKMYTVRTGYSIRHIAVAPNDDVYFNINGNYQGKQYKITNEVLVEGNTSNTTTGFETIVGNSAWGAMPSLGYSGSANIAVGTGSVDGSPNGMAYDEYRGRLYFSLSADSRLYYLQLSSIVL